MKRKDELLDRALDYFLEHGLAELSLRPLAKEIGSSSRLLIYHFGTKEKLITAVMDMARTRTQQSFHQLMAQPRQTSDFRTYWDWATDPKNTGYIRLLFEVQVLALQKPQLYAQYLEDSSSSWLSAIESRMPKSENSRAIATLSNALIDGLMLDYMSSGDLQRTTEALELFDSLLKARQ